jgi:hypothetical protein
MLFVACFNNKNHYVCFLRELGIFYKINRLISFINQLISCTFKPKCVKSYFRYLTFLDFFTSIIVNSIFNNVIRKFFFNKLRIKTKFISTFQLLKLEKRE